MKSRWLSGLAVVVLAGCASTDGLEYYSTSGEVDRRPECAGTEFDRPEAGVPRWCHRTVERRRNDEDRVRFRVEGDDGPD